MGKSMNRIQEDINIKDDNIADTDMYLRETLPKISLEGGKMCWTMSDDHYVKAAVTNVEKIPARGGIRLQLKCVTPFSRKYSPWL